MVIRHNMSIAENTANDIRKEQCHEAMPASSGIVQKTVDDRYDSTTKTVSGLSAEGRYSSHIHNTLFYHLTAYIPLTPVVLS